MTDGLRVLDGRALARERERALTARSARVVEARGRPPRLLLVAFRDAAGTVPFVEAKLRDCARCGVEALPLLLPAGAGTGEALERLGAALAREDPDGVFVQFPFPPGVDGAALGQAIPPARDVDVLGARSTARYLAGRGNRPPLAAAAALALLDRAGVALEGRAGVVVGDPIPYHELFREALVRRGAVMAPVVSPGSGELEAVLARAEVVVVSAARPGWVPARWLAPGAVVVDAGYFNPGGRGDVDTTWGVEHLAVLVPVPGGVGPMTVSMLVEAVIEVAEDRAASPGG